MFVRKTKNYNEFHYILGNYHPIYYMQNHHVVNDYVNRRQYVLVDDNDVLVATASVELFEEEDIHYLKRLSILGDNYGHRFGISMVKLLKEKYEDLTLTIDPNNSKMISVMEELNFNYIEETVSRNGKNTYHKYR